MMEWRPFLARVGVAALVGGATLTLAVFMGIRLAAADPPGPTRDALTFAGVLRSPPTAPTPLVFEFTRTGTSPATCTATTSPVTFDSTGAFSIEVPITCPTAGGRAFFNGDPVTYTVRLASDAGSPGELLTDGGVAITAVPYARFADQAGVNNDCPAGFVLGREATDAPGTVCIRNVSFGATTVRDEVVKVGNGATAFWVDRYEASVHDRSTGAQLSRSNTMGGVNGADIASTGLSPSGQRSAANAPAVALSHVGQPTVYVTWFQANEACHGAGKRLPTGSEWLEAASGTVDGGNCNFSSDGARAAAAENLCRSASGVHDMIGNVGEWTDEWYAGVGAVTSPVVRLVNMLPDGGVVDGGIALSVPTLGARVTGTRVNDGLEPWPADYGDGHDQTANVTSTANDDRESNTGMPAAATRGGHWASGTGAGVFAIYLVAGPSYRNSHQGFRCVIPR